MFGRCPILHLFEIVKARWRLDDLTTWRLDDMATWQLDGLTAWPYYKLSTRLAMRHRGSMRWSSWCFHVWITKYSCPKPQRKEANLENQKACASVFALPLSPDQARPLGPFSFHLFRPFATTATYGHRLVSVIIRDKSGLRVGRQRSKERPSYIDENLQSLVQASPSSCGLLILSSARFERLNIIYERYYDVEIVETIEKDTRETQNSYSDFAVNIWLLANKLHGSLIHNKTRVEQKD